MRYFSVFNLFNPLNPPYQGDFKRNCVSPVIEEFPDLKEMQIHACLDYARQLAEFEEVA